MLIHLDNLSIETTVEELAVSNYEDLFKIFIILIEADKEFQDQNLQNIFYLFGQDNPDDFMNGMNFYNE
ncbi:MAG: hypothetical protein ACOCRK_05485 [bacterium]